MWDEPGAPAGWKRGIKYNNKEYEEVLRRVAEIRKRLGVRADHCEKVAWVLGKEGADLDSAALKAEVEVEAEAEAEAQDPVEENEEDITGSNAKRKEKKRTVTAKPVVTRPKKETQPPSKEKGTKRKARQPDALPEGVRRSSRRRTDAYYGED
jgi:hypothetical protein